MKINLPNGTTIEASFEEYQKMKESGMLEETTTESSKQQEETLIKQGPKLKYWTEEEDDIVIEGYNNATIPGRPNSKELKEICKKLTYRTKGAVITRAKTLKSLTKKPTYCMDGKRGPYKKRDSIIKKIVVVPKETKKQGKGRQGLMLTAEEQKILFDNLHLELKDIAEKLGVNTNRLGYYVSKLGGLYKLRKQMRIKGPSPKHLKTDEMRARMSFISSRANSLMKLHNWDRQKAFAQASTEWSAKGQKQVPVKNSIFPKFPQFTEQGQKIFEGMIKHLIETEGCIEYSEAYCIERVDGKWTAPKWKDFCINFMTKSGVIAEYFGVKDKFRLKIAAVATYKIHYT